MRVIYCGLINWLATWIICEGKVFEDVREWLKKRFGEESKWAYLSTCHLCAGTWVGLGLSILLPGPLVARTPIASWMLNGLLYKAVGHLILEMASYARFSVALKSAQYRETQTQGEAPKPVGYRTK